MKIVGSPQHKPKNEKSEKKLFYQPLFVAAVALDLRRLQQNGNGFIVCYKHKNHTISTNTGELNMRRKIFKAIGEAINSIYGKVSKILQGGSSIIFALLFN